MVEPIPQIDVSHGQGTLIGDNGVVRNTFHTTVNAPTPAAPAVWPVWVGSAPPLADCFQDRAEGDLLAGWTDDSGTVVLTQVLSGLGGVGKSQLAAQLAARRWLARSVDLLVWVTASTRSAIVAGFAQAAERVGIAGPHKGDDAAARMLQWLAATDQRWLIVLDDVNDPADLHGWWPPPSPTGATVVTTRRRDAAFSGHGRRRLEVGLFTMDEATAYLQAKLATRLDLADDVTGVATDLGRLPLALAQAAAYLLDEEIRCSRYRQLFADCTRQLAGLVPEPTSLPDSHHHTVDVTWSMSIQAANRHRPTGLAGPLLRWAALLDAEGIPEQVLTAPATLEYLTLSRGDGDGDAADEIVNPDMVRQAARCLHRFNLVSHDPSNPARALRVHALVQRSIRERTPPAILDQAAKAAAAALIEAWPDIERDPQLGQALRANTNALHTTRPDSLWTEPYGCHRVLLYAGDTIGQVGQVALAAKYFRQLHQVATQRLGPDHPDTLTTRHNMARWQGHAGDPATAAIALNELLHDCLRVLGPDHPHTLTGRHNLAHWRGQAGDPAGAAAALAELLGDRLRVLGPDHPQTLATRSSLARWRGQDGDPLGAAAAYAELLDDRLRILGSDHPDTLATRHNLAHWRGQAGDPAVAATALAELLNDRLRVLGPDHPDTQATRNNLALWYQLATQQSLSLAADS